MAFHSHTYPSDILPPGRLQPLAFPTQDQLGTKYKCPTVEGQKGLVEKQDSLRVLSFTGVADESLCFSGGLALAQVLFFYVKYLVLFGAPALLMRLDGLTPPPLPRCVSTMFSFTGMWRSVS